MDDKDLEKYISNMSNVLFPGGKTETRKIVKKIHDSLSFDLSKEDCEGMYYEFKFFMSGYKIRLKFDVQENLNYLLGYIQRKIGKTIDISQSYDFIECCMKCDIDIFSALVSCGFYSNYEAVLPTKDTDDFGYSVDHPIGTAGIGYNTLYLDRLRTIEGKHIKYNRLKGIPNPKLGEAYSSLKRSEFFGPANPYRVVDEYEIFDDNGVFIKNLYVCPYYKTTSTTAPEGFILGE